MKTRIFNGSPREICNFRDKSMKKISAILFDMYGVILEESKENFMSYTCSDTESVIGTCELGTISLNDLSKLKNKTKQ